MFMFREYCAMIASALSRGLVRTMDIKARSCTEYEEQAVSGHLSSGASECGDITTRQQMALKKCSFARSPAVEHCYAVEHVTVRRADETKYWTSTIIYSKETISTSL